MDNGSPYLTESWRLKGGVSFSLNDSEAGHAACSFLAKTLHVVVFGAVLVEGIAIVIDKLTQIK